MRHRSALLAVALLLPFAHAQAQTATRAAPPSLESIDSLAHAAIATSGDFFQHVEINGVRYSHIVDPHTGVGLTDHSLVTILGPDCTTADGLGTAVSAVGPERGLKLIEETPGVAARIVRKPGGQIELHRSARWQATAR